MKVSVTQEHIDKGKKGAPCGCPIALAIKEQTPWMVSVYGGFVDVGPTRVQLPDPAREFIVRFDLEKGVEPFEFELAAVEGIGPDA